MNSRMARTLAGVVLASVLSTSAAHASPFSTAYFFGDSLSDTGNVFAGSGGTFPPAPYFNGRFSNGPVWVERLAAGLGVPGASTAALQGGNNYAFGGARTGFATSPVPDILAQLVGLWGPAHLAADPDALYVIAGGGNDMRDARSAFQTNSAGDQAGRQAAAITAAGNITNALGFLAAKGAKHVLLMNLPDLGNSPEAAALGLTDPSRDASARFNALMPNILTSGLTFGLDMHFLDAASLMQSVINDALTNGGATYGITNVFTPCAPFPGNIGISCNTSLFSDALHPSAAAHRLLGDAALRAVPEPATLVLVTLGAIGAVRRRRAA